jgi:pimeloyl-ACP methyl ester carboxylesterase
MTHEPEQPCEIRVAAGRKQPLHFGARGRPLFGFYHPPGDGLWRGTGVVLCCPLGTDHTRSDRAYRHLAERLATAGFACLRYDPFGTGDSGGDGLAPGILRDWLDDVGVAVDELRARSGARQIALVGLRLGATLAMVHAAERGDVDSLVLWEPCVSGAAFVREAVTFHKVYLRIEPLLADAAPPQPGGEEALGLFLPGVVIEALSQLDLLQTARCPARRALVIDGGNLAGRDALLGRLRELGATSELRTHTGQRFLITVSHRALVPEPVLDSIVGWLTDAHPPRETPAPPARGSTGVGPSGERALVFGAQKNLFGLITPADPARARPGRPSIVIANAGCVNRSGPHRLSVRMARRWASLGFDVLRIDLAGIGDSPAPPGAPENVTYPPSGLGDLADAIHAAGATRTIVAGLCSGGDYAFHLGARDARVEGAWILNPRTFGVVELAAGERGEGMPPAAVDEDVPRSLRVMAARGVDTLLVVSRNDPGVAYVDAHAGEEMSALAAVPGFRRVDLSGTDHTFTPVAAQEHVSDVLTEHLAVRY